MFLYFNQESAIVRCCYPKYAIILFYPFYFCNRQPCFPNGFYKHGCNLFNIHNATLSLLILVLEKPLQRFIA